MQYLKTILNIVFKQSVAAIFNPNLIVNVAKRLIKLRCVRPTAMNFTVPFAILAFSSAISAYDVEDDVADLIARPDSDECTDSTVPQEDILKSVSQNPLQIALSRIFEIRWRHNNLAATNLAKKVSSVIEPMNQVENITTTNAYHVNTTEISNYGPNPGRFTEHHEATLIFMKKSGLFVYCPKSIKETLKNNTFESEQQRQYSNISEILN